MESMGLREFGRWVEKSPEAVRKAIATGKIPADCVGERALSSGRLVPVITNPEKARTSWGVNSNPAMQRDKAKLAAGRAAAHARDRGEEPHRPAAPPRDDTEGEGGGRGARGLPTITESNAVKAAYQARMARLEYEKEVGKLVNAEEVRLRLVNMITAARNRLLGVPTKAKMRIPTLTVHDIELLEELIAEALQEVAVDGS